MKFTENSTSRIAAEAQSLLNEIASLPRNEAVSCVKEISHGGVYGYRQRIYP